MHRLIFALTLLIASQLAPAAPAQEGPQPQAASAPVVTMTLEQLAAQIEAEREALEERGASEAEWASFEGKVLKLTGQYAASAQAYRRVLALEPENLAARQELAHALFLARDFRAAKFHFETLERADPNEGRRGLYRRFLGLIAQNQPFGVSGFFSIVPSSNVNRGTTNTTFRNSFGEGAIAEESQQTSGIGVALGASGYFRRIVSNTRRASLIWSLSGTRYEDSSFDNTAATVGVSVETIEDWGNWSVQPFVRRTWREPDSSGNDYDNDAVGIRLSGRVGLDARHALSGSVSHEVRDYDSQDQQDGPFTAATLTLERQVSPALSVWGGLGFERSKPEQPYLRYDGSRVFAGVANAWTGGLQTSAQIEFGQRPFEADFPGLTEARRDEYGRLSIGLRHGQFNYMGFAPQLNCSRTINGSNVALYDYTATDCQIALSREF